MQPTEEVDLPPRGDDAPEAPAPEEGDDLFAVAQENRRFAAEALVVDRE